MLKSHQILAVLLVQAVSVVVASDRTTILDHVGRKNQEDDAKRFAEQSAVSEEYRGVARRFRNYLFGQLREGHYSVGEHVTVEGANGLRLLASFQPGVNGSEDHINFVIDRANEGSFDTSRVVGNIDPADFPVLPVREYLKHVRPHLQAGGGKPVVVVTDVSYADQQQRNDAVSIEAKGRCLHGVCSVPLRKN